MTPKNNCKPPQKKEIDGKHPRTAAKGEIKRLKTLNQSLKEWHQEGQGFVSKHINPSNEILGFGRFVKSVVLGTLSQALNIKKRLSIRNLSSGSAS